MENLASRTDISLMMDYGQIYFLGGGGTFEGEWHEFVDQAIADGLVTSDGHNLVVLSPHQNNFDLQMTVELWTSPPAADDDDWQIVVHETIKISDDQTLTIDSAPGGHAQRVAIPTGSYRIDIAASGFKTAGSPGSTTPGDRWRVRLWPSDDSETPANKRWI